jgi:hypothetical protein
MKTAHGINAFRRRTFSCPNPQSVNGVPVTILAICAIANVLALDAALAGSHRDLVR